MESKSNFTVTHDREFFFWIGLGILCLAGLTLAAILGESPAPWPITAFLVLVLLALLLLFIRFALYRVTVSGRRICVRKGFRTFHFDIYTIQRVDWKAAETNFGWNAVLTVRANKVTFSVASLMKKSETFRAYILDNVPHHKIHRTLRSLKTKQH